MVFGLRLGLPKKTPAAEPPRQDPEPTREKKGSHSSGGGGGGPSGKNALTVNEFVARTKRCREKGLEPTKPELIAYARYLGVDPITDADLMWIVDEALNAPLPSEWTEHHDSADRVFYYNVQTHASSWTHPLEQLHRDTYTSIVSFRSGEISKEDQAIELEKLRRKCEESEGEAHKELQAWTEHVDEQGQKFYYNRDQQRSVWTDPRPARCHSLYLQMKALRVLAKHCGQSVSTSGKPADVLGSEVPDARAPLSDRTREDESSKNQIPLSFGHSAPVESDTREKEKKEKKRKKHRDRDDGHDTSGYASADELSVPRTSSGGLNGLEPLDELVSAGKMKMDALELNRPSTSVVNEVRAALGMAERSRQPLRSPDVLSRLPTPPGDGLSNVGRTKVRAGIRLEPIK